MGTDRRELATMIRPLGIGRSSLPKELTALEVVAWIATSDFALVNGASAYEPSRLVEKEGLAARARMSAVRMDVEEGFCRCGGSPERIKNKPGPRCRCFSLAADKWLKACQSGQLAGRLGGAVIDRNTYDGLMLVADPAPLFPWADVKRLWPKRRDYRVAEKLGPDVSVPEVLDLVARLGDVGQRKTRLAAKEHYGPRRVKDAVIREACRIAFPGKTQGRPVSN